MNTPQNWRTLSFEDCLKKIKQIKRPSILREKYQEKGLYPIIDQSMEYIAGWTDNSESVISEDLPVIIFGDHTRIFKYVDFPFAAGADGTKIIRSNSEIINPEFFYFSLLNLDVPNKGYSRHYKYLREFSISFPNDKIEQQAIAKVLRTIQFAIQTRQCEIELERERKAALMHLLIKTDEIEQSWRPEKLGKVTIITMGQSPPGETYNTSGNGLPLINGPAEFGREFPTPVQWTTMPTKICKVGDILFCVRGNTTGRMNIADQEYCIGRGIAAIRGIPDISDTTFIKYLLEKESSSLYNIAVGGGSTFPNIGGNQLKGYSIFLPSLPEQQEIASVLHACDTKIATLERESALLDELFKAMLEELMTGRLSATPLIEQE